MNYDFGKDDWFTGRENFKLLTPLAGEPCNLLEIGSHEGRSTTWLIDNLMSHPKSRLTAIDKWVRPTLRKNVEMSGRSQQVTLLEGRSRDVLCQLPSNAYDFVYIDGDHSAPNVLGDALQAFRLAKVGGVIGFDDYGWGIFGAGKDCHEWGIPKPAIDVFCYIFGPANTYKPMIDFVVAHNDFQVWVRKIADEPSPKLYARGIGEQ